MDTTNKYKILIIGILMDAVGILTSSWILPGVGDFADIAWAPFSAWIMTKMYKGTAGKVAGVVTFVEEIIPFVDVVPSFTLMWLYTYVFKDSKVGTMVDKGV
ncbi:hypothetical protein EAX61_08115 [Dokdonia sinensis]|uniref:Uncharacterized protein n=1 Tax=Dokdonia sinensis TaxID=2479847 RepID=A0A3M0GEF2_9FLAO|nr:hypothetical protein [Dokdonia sinensis]RMB59539.1 hypothetical protein EAX61_08115 [Dokdonia sinensis]